MMDCLPKKEAGSSIAAGPGEKTRVPNFFLYFLQLNSLEHSPKWIRIDMITGVNVEKVRPDMAPTFYRVRVNDSSTVAEVSTEEDADALVERILTEVSMRLSQLYGAGRTR